MTKTRGLHGGRWVQMDNFLPGSTYTGRNLQMWGFCHFCQANAWHFVAKANSNSSACPFANRCCNWYLSHPQNTWHPTQTNFYQPKREKASKERCHLLLTLSRELLSGSRRPAFRRYNVFGGPCTYIAFNQQRATFFSIPVSHPTCHFFCRLLWFVRFRFYNYTFLCLSWIVFDLSQKFTPILMGL